jgi:dihydroneopterin aldolase
MTHHAFVDLEDLKISAQIGSYGPNDVIPDQHLLNLRLKISPELVLIQEDQMSRVFDYDPLIAEINRLAEDGHYETQERLLTRIVYACAAYSQIEAIDIKLTKFPVQSTSGCLGISLSIDREDLVELRRSENA